MNFIGAASKENEDFNYVENTIKIAREKIKGVLVHNYKKIEKIINASRGEYCILEKMENLNSPDKSLHDQKDFYQHLGKFGSGLSELLKTADGIDYLKNTKIQDICVNSIDSFMVCDGKSKLIEIHTRCVSPSKAEILRKRSVLRQFCHRIEEKIDGEQLCGKINTIIALNFNDVIFHGYGGYVELRRIIENIFNKKEDKEILGVILYQTNLKCSKFVKNPNAKLNNKISEKINILIS